jgi:hypothetical protein
MATAENKDVTKTERITAKTLFSVEVNVATYKRAL